MVLKVWSLDQWHQLPLETSVFLTLEHGQRASGQEWVLVFRLWDKFPDAAGAAGRMEGVALGGPGLQMLSFSLVLCREREG